MADEPKLKGFPKGPLRRPRPELSDEEFEEWRKGLTGNPGKEPKIKREK